LKGGRAAWMGWHQPLCQRELRSGVRPPYGVRCPSALDLQVVLSDALVLFRQGKECHSMTANSFAAESWS